MKVNANFAKDYSEMAVKIQDILVSVESSPDAEFLVLIQQKGIVIYLCWKGGYSERVCEVATPNIDDTDKNIVYLLSNIDTHEVKKFVSTTDLAKYFKERYDGFVSWYSKTKIS